MYNSKTRAISFLASYASSTAYLSLLPLHLIFGVPNECSGGELHRSPGVAEYECRLLFGIRGHQLGQLVGQVHLELEVGLSGPEEIAEDDFPQLHRSLLLSELMTVSGNAVGNVAQPESHVISVGDRGGDSNKTNARRGGGV